MSAAEHVESLKAKHQDLEHLIVEEEGRPHPDQALITQLKRQKLRIKDEIAHLAHAYATAARLLRAGARVVDRVLGSGIPAQGWFCRPGEAMARRCGLTHRFYDVLAHLLGVTEQHHRVVAEE